MPLEVSTIQPMVFSKCGVIPESPIMSSLSWATRHDLIVSGDEEDLTMMLNVSMGDTIGCCFPLLKY